MLILKNILLFLKSIIPEVLIIGIFIFLINNYIGNEKATIKSDSIGYYDYLPSIFIHHDFVRKDVPVKNDHGIYKRINNIDFYIDYDGYKVNRCPCGTAVLEMPFFIRALLKTDLERNFADGYQTPFHIAVFHAAVFYLFLSIFFLKKILKLYDIKKHIIILCQLLLVLATSVTNYANFDAGFSHVYSLFAITAFLYFIASYFKKRDFNHFILACLLFGLILLLRQVNVLIIFFVPFLAGSIKNFKDGVIHLFRHPFIFLSGIFLTSAVFLIQSLCYYLQAGHFYIYTYQGYGFNFLDPQIINILFSYRKGLFVYSPVLFLTLSGLVYLVYRRKYYLVLTWSAFFIFLTYVLSSWWVWYYGASYGLRAYIDYYAVFFIPFAIMLNEIPRVLKFIFIGLSLLTIPLNIIQTYQYKNYILEWGVMDRVKYWKVFLKTDKRYEGILWKKHFDDSQYRTLKEVNIGNIRIPSNSEKVYCMLSSKDIPGFQEINMIQILIDNDFRESNDAELFMTVNETDRSHFSLWSKRFLIHFADDSFNKWQTGVFYFELDPITDPKEKIFELAVISGKYAGTLKNVRLRFMSSVKTNK
ncbi:MAG: hypothetical protein NTU98_09440 [Bacteroidetes bacterium]|nr:hypothetical protein [Bacteroidota bacterium]